MEVDGGWGVGLGEASRLRRFPQFTVTLSQVVRAWPNYKIEDWSSWSVGACNWVNKL